jgi:hypothetical protein
MTTSIVDKLFLIVAIVIGEIIFSHCLSIGFSQTTLDFCSKQIFFFEIFFFEKKEIFLVRQQNQQRLHRAEKNLENNDILSYFNTQKESAIYLTVQLFGDTMPTRDNAVLITNHNWMPVIVDNSTGKRHDAIMCKQKLKKSLSQFPTCAVLSDLVPGTVKVIEVPANSTLLKQKNTGLETESSSQCCKRIIRNGEVVISADDQSQRQKAKLLENKPNSQLIKSNDTVKTNRKVFSIQHTMQQRASSSYYKRYVHSRYRGNASYCFLFGRPHKVQIWRLKDTIGCGKKSFQYVFAVREKHDVCNMDNTNAISCRALRNNGRLDQSSEMSHEDKCVHTGRQHDVTNDNVDYNHTQSDLNQRTMHSLLDEKNTTHALEIATQVSMKCTNQNDVDNAFGNTINVSNKNIDDHDNNEGHSTSSMSETCINNKSGKNDQKRQVSRHSSKIVQSIQDNTNRHHNTDNNDFMPPLQAKNSPTTRLCNEQGKVAVVAESSHTTNIINNVNMSSCRNNNVNDVRNASTKGNKDITVIHYDRSDTNNANDHVIHNNPNHNVINPKINDSGNKMSELKWWLESCFITFNKLKGKIIGDSAVYEQILQQQMRARVKIAKQDGTLHSVDWKTERFPPILQMLSDIYN